MARITSPPIPGHTFLQRMDFQDWEEGKPVEWIDWIFQMLDKFEDAFDYQQYKVYLDPIEKGPWKIERNEIGRREWARIYYVVNGVEPNFGRDCGWGDTTILKKQNEEGEWETWMSDTRAEIVEHIPLINKLWWTQSIEPSVLINGLGLGVAVKAAQMHNARRIDVVEIDKDVIDLVGPKFADDPRVTIHHADAHEIRWPVGTQWTLAWHDIWPTIAAENIPEMDRLRRRYKRKVQWQDCWQRKDCLLMRRKQKQYQEALEAQDWQRVRELDPHF